MFCFVRCGDLREGDQSLTNTGVFVKEVCSPQTEATTWPEGDALLKKQSVKKEKKREWRVGEKKRTRRKSFQGQTRTSVNECSTPKETSSLMCRPSTS